MYFSGHHWLWPKKKDISKVVCREETKKIRMIAQTMRSKLFYFFMCMATPAKKKVQNFNCMDGETSHRLFGIPEDIFYFSFDCLLS